MQTFITTPAPEIYYSDGPIKADAILGFNYKDPNNVAYTLYNKNYGTFQRFQGFSILLDAATISQSGDQLDFYIENENGPPSYYSSYNRVVNDSTRLRLYVTKAEMEKLGEGKFNLYGSITSGNRVYIISPKTLELKKP
ncbi:hypothetical protein [Pseudomonas glycinae]|uniref:hypothetical protein n=1 Tax=Pseudomonas glycinae TaxID=1785145 RepID=UPI001F19522E|nr:hypothetical protein [Pseudomonas glycinae]